MSVLYLNENGMTVGVEGNRVTVKHKNGMVKSIPIETLEGIMMMGKNQLTIQCMEVCLREGIPVAFLSKGGSYFGRLMSPGHIKPELQRKQSLLYDTEFSVNLAKKIMAAKISNQRAVLRTYTRSARVDCSEMDVHMQRSLSHIPKCDRIAEIIGYEGTAAKYYFKGLAKCVREEFAFSGRNRRPPRDPFNSMLSLGYSIIMNIIYAEIETKGLNPYFGFVHRDAEKHPTLASDLMEEWRAVLIDSMVMALINGNEIHREEFYLDVESGGCYITRDGLKVMLKKLDNKLKTESKYLSYVDYGVSFRRAIGLQVGRLVQAIEENDPDIYTPIRIR